MARDQGASSRARRSFCWMFAGVLIAPGTVIAQSSKAVRHIGWLQGGGPDTPAEQQQVDDALAAVGWIVGKNVLLDRRFVRFDDLPRAAEDFVNDKVDLIIAN